MSDCKKCEAESTCFDEPKEDCKDFRETEEARRSRIESEVKAHDERIRADERRTFAEWLDKNEHLFCHCKEGNETNIECVLREYEEEQKK